MRIEMLIGKNSLADEPADDRSRLADNSLVQAFPAPLSPHTSRLGVFSRLLSFPCLAAAVFAALVSCMVPRSMADPDIWWHLRNAENLFQRHAFIVKDTYSFTAIGAPWINHEWLAELPFYIGWRTLGPHGVFLTTAVAGETIMLGVFYLAYRHSRSNAATMLVSTIAALLATVSFGPRTLLFGWVFLVAELILLERFRSSGRVLWTLPWLFAAWVNTHGSWLIGIVLLIVFIACGSVRIHTGAIHNAAWSPAQLRKLAVSASLSVAALFVNPYGWRLVAYPFNLAFHQKLNIANVQEWSTLDFHSMRGRLLFITLAALFLLQLVRPRKWTLHELAFLIIGVYSAFNYSRFLFLAAILVMPLAAKDLPAFNRPLPAQNRPAPNRPGLNAALLLALIPLVAFRSPAHPDQALDPAETKYPVRALAYLQNFHAQGNVFNDYLWGGFLDWHTRQIPVMIDSRVDIFEDNGTFKDYLDAVQMRRTDEVLNKYNIRYILFESDAPMVSFLLQTPAWKVDYRDQTTILLERTGPLPSEALPPAPGL